MREFELLPEPANGLKPCERLTADFSVAQISIVNYRNKFSVCSSLLLVSDPGYRDEMKIIVSRNKIIYILFYYCFSDLYQNLLPADPSSAPAKYSATSMIILYSE